MAIKPCCNSVTRKEQ